jgi:hypothetical protein
MFYALICLCIYIYFPAKSIICSFFFFFFGWISINKGDKFITNNTNIQRKRKRVGLIDGQTFIELRATFGTKLKNTGRVKAMELLLLLLLKIIITIAFLGLVSKLIQMGDALIWKPKRLRSILQKQGITGPPPSVLLGNTGDMKKMKSSASKAQQKGEQAITHNCSSAIFPFFDEWRKSYGNQ